MADAELLDGDAIFTEFDQQYRFHASLQGMPALPEWLRYIYSGRHHSGFIFGTPPRGSAGTKPLEVIGLNRQDYETRRVTLPLNIQPKEKMARYEVELKIDNLNVEDLLDEHKLNRLKDIFRTKLWTESSSDLYATFLASAIDLGARLPLKPSDGEGLVIRLGSTAPFSVELKRLREEVRPLSRLPSCPREYKRTTVERLFRDAGMTLDWCSFELYVVVQRERSTVHLEYLSELRNTSERKYKEPHTQDIWTAPSKCKLPKRNYGNIVMAAVLIPMLLMCLCLTGLTFAFCALQASVRDPESEIFLDDIFHICIDYRNKRGHRSKRSFFQYWSNTEPSQVPDDVSGAGVSPNSSPVRLYSPRAPPKICTCDYNRPQPPPYMGSATNSLHKRRTDSRSHTPEHRQLLEESLKLLNDAKIFNEFDIKDPIIDLNDGGEDYVPIKADDFVENEDLDDIAVPEHNNYGDAGAIRYEENEQSVKTWFC